MGICGRSPSGRGNLSKGPGAGAAVRVGQVGEPSTAGPQGPPGLTLPPPGLRAAGLSLCLPSCVKQGHNFSFCSAAKTKYASEGVTQQI